MRWLTLAVLLSGIKHRLFYGWVVVIALFIILSTVLGIRSSFGVFFKSIESEFFLTRAATSSIFSVYMVICAGVAILGGWALDRYGPRVVVFVTALFATLGLVLTSQTSFVWEVFVAYGLLVAIGTGAVFTVVTATTSRWFVKKRGLALGIGLSGEGMGTLAIAPLAAYLISACGWRTAYIIMGLAAGVVISLLSLLLRKSPAEMGLSPDGEKAIPGNMGMESKGNGVQPVSFSPMEALSTKNFWFLWLSTLCYTLAHFIIQTHLVPRVTDLGISPVAASVMLALIGAGNITGRILMGIASDVLGRKLSAVSCALLQVAMMVWMAWAHTSWMFYFIALLSGFAFGGLSTTVIAMLGDTFGVGRLGAIMGVIVVGFSLGAALGPYIGGFIFDVTSNYFVAFLTGAAITLLAVLFVALVRRR